MTESGPRILVVDDAPDERMLITSVLREAGFQVVATAEEGASAALAGGGFAAAVIALADGEGANFLRRARRQQAALRALLVVEPAALRLVEEDCATLVKRPFDLRELLGCVFAVVLREDEPQAAPAHSHVAEFGIAAARLACLHNRRDAAAAVGAHHLAQDLTRQIGEATAARGGLPASFGHLAAVR